MGKRQLTTDLQQRAAVDFNGFMHYTEIRKGIASPVVNHKPAKDK